MVTSHSAHAPYRTRFSVDGHEAYSDASEVKGGDEEVRQQLPGNTNAAGPIFDRLDQDQDGKLYKAEFSRIEQLGR